MCIRDRSYGVPGKTTDPEVKAAIDTITAKTLAAGKAVGTTAASAEAAKALIAKGVQYILLSSDCLLYTSRNDCAFISGIKYIPLSPYLSI